MSAAVIFVIGLIQLQSLFATVYYINPKTDSTINDGTSWNTPYKTLEDGLAAANKISDELWLIGDHIFVPSTTNRDSCYSTTNGLKIYGGFYGNESSISQRLDGIFETILSGNINRLNDKSDNCYHVITYTNQLTLDGITIQDGYANKQRYVDKSMVLHKYGGALITFDGSRPTNLKLNNVIFTNNYALNGGALWFMSNSKNNVNALITNCIFKSNYAINGEYEGGINLFCIYNTFEIYLMT